MRWLVKSGLVLNRSKKTFEPLDILGEGEKILAIQPDINEQVDTKIDAKGCYILPGLVDLHAHVGEPGNEQRETLLSLTEAGKRGGFTDLLIMPDTHPQRRTVQECQGFIYEVSLLKPRLYPAASLTWENKTPTEWGQLAEIGIKAMGDCTPLSSFLMRRALSYLSKWNVLVLADCIDPELSRGTNGREGVFSTIFGLRGVPAEAEEMAVVRDLLLARLSKGHLHIQHLSSKGSLTWLELAKNDGVQVSAEVSWLHLLATDSDLEDYDTNFKLRPPLGTEEDRLSLIQGVKDGLIDAVVSDHTPFSKQDKDVEFELAPPGAAGLEMFLPALYAGLVETGLLSFAELCEAISFRPAKRLFLPEKELTPGNRGDLVIFDPNKNVDRTDFQSLAANYPKVPMKGSVKATILDGHVIYSCGGKL